VVKRAVQGRGEGKASYFVLQRTGGKAMHGRKERRKNFLLFLKERGPSREKGGGKKGGFRRRN